MNSSAIPSNAVCAIGTMSGTSLDGVDVACIETDGERALALGPSHTRPYSPAERDLLRRALAEAVVLTDRAARPGILAEAEALVTRAHHEAIEDFLTRHAIDRAGIAVVGFHGQTVLHRPEARLTIQIGNGEGLACALGLPVVFDLRAADVAAGGQGAPLVPAWHRALALSRVDLPRPLVMANIGGVANVTFLDGEAEPIAFDTGPGNALLDDLMLEREGAPFDRDGTTAAAGQPNPAALAVLMAHPFLTLPPPKSLDRNDFSRAVVAPLATPDAAATLTAFTARSLAAAADHLPSRPRLWVVTGGGARNPTLLAHLAAAVAEGGGAVTTADALGWSADAMEAQAFAFLAVRSLRGLPLTFPGTTGCPAPTRGGVLAQPRAAA